MINILYLETGVTGGGSFESLYEQVRELDREKFAPVVVFLNESKYLISVN